VPVQGIPPPVLSLGKEELVRGWAKDGQSSSWVAAGPVRLSHSHCCCWLYQQCPYSSLGMSRSDKSQALCLTFIGDGQAEVSLHPPFSATCPHITLSLLEVMWLMGSKPLAAGLKPLFSLL